MLRYDLDKLGWYEFEQLCQTLLKHKIGLELKHGEELMTGVEMLFMQVP